MDTEKIEIKLILNSELYQQLEMLAAQKGLPLKEYIEQALEQAMEEREKSRQRKQGINSAAVEGLLHTSEEIMHAHPDEVFDSAETLHQLREERTRDLEQR